MLKEKYGYAAYVSHIQITNASQS